MLNADLLYSVLLMIALAAAAAGAIPGLIRLTPVAGAFMASARFLKVLPLLLVVAVLSGMASMIIHATAGHGADSPEPLAVSEFLVNHKVFVLVAVFVLAGAVGLRAERPETK